jgi:hypothetical protein
MDSNNLYHRDFKAALEHAGCPQPSASMPWGIRARHCSEELSTLQKSYLHLAGCWAQ